jgi:zinc-ribbon domain
MYCPKCSASVADDSNFCPRCGTPFNKRRGFVANLWRDNKPGFLILSLLLIAMLGSIGYYLSSRTGRFVVTVDRVDANEALDIYAKAAMESYCREFQAECLTGRKDALEKEIKKIIPGLFRDNIGGYARIRYQNNTGSPVTTNRLKHRQPPGSWISGNSRTYYQPKIDRLRGMGKQLGLTFEQKIDLAMTIATVDHSVPFTLQPGQTVVWCLINESSDRERQVDYTQNGKSYQTPILRAGNV